MSDQPEASSSFAKAFLPGLVLGLIVGLAIGALVGPLLERSPELKAVPGVPKTPAAQRDPHPSEMPARNDDAAKPTDKPADPPKPPASAAPSQP